MKYSQDPIGARCLELAKLSKAKVGFGAVFLDSNGALLGEGRNRRSRIGENDILGGGVDYAAHAEQAALLDAFERRTNVAGGKLYVIGVVLRGPRKGLISVRSSVKDKYFSCVRCAKTLNRFNVSVCIPLPNGWHQLSPANTLRSAQKFKKLGRRLEFTTN